MSASDVYESLAFLEAAESEVMILVYPVSPQGGVPADTGAAQVFQRVQVVPGRSLRCRWKLEESPV